MVFIGFIAGTGYLRGLLGMCPETRGSSMSIDLKCHSAVTHNLIHNISQAKECKVTGSEINVEIFLMFWSEFVISEQVLSGFN